MLTRALPFRNTLPRRLPAEEHSKHGCLAECLSFLTSMLRNIGPHQACAMTRCLMRTSFKGPMFLRVEHVDYTMGGERCTWFQVDVCITKGDDICIFLHPHMRSWFCDYM